MARTVLPHISMKRQTLHSSTAGFSLVEMLMVVAIISMTMLYVFPRAGAVIDRVNVRGARARVVNTFNQGRVVARQNNRTIRFHVASNRVWLATAAGVTWGSVQPLRATYGVTVTFTQDSTGIDPRGFSSGTNTIVLTRNGAADTVVIDGHGRIIR